MWNVRIRNIVLKNQYIWWYIVIIIVRFKEVVRWQDEEVIGWLCGRPGQRWQHVWRRRRHDEEPSSRSLRHARRRSLTINQWRHLWGEAGTAAVAVDFAAAADARREGDGGGGKWGEQGEDEGREEGGSEDEDEDGTEQRDVSAHQLRHRQSDSAAAEEESESDEQGNAIVFSSAHPEQGNVIVFSSAHPEQGNVIVFSSAHPEQGNVIVFSSAHPEQGNVIVFSSSHPEQGNVIVFSSSHPEQDNVIIIVFSSHLVM